METTATVRRRPQRAEDFTRTGALWVTATGAFLLVVAAAVFVAVRWNHMPDPAKLAILVALSASSLLAGRLLRPRLPATAAVLYHLGAFLLPVVAAAVALHFDAGWQVLLLVDGIVGALAFTALEHLHRSVVLRTAAAIAVVLAALGLGATAGMVPAAVLAVAAVAAEAAKRHHLAVFWALIAGLAPAIGLAAPLLVSTRVLDELALTGSAMSGLALPTALATAGVLFVEARARRDLILLVAAGTALALGGVAVWVEVQPAGQTAWLAGAVLFLALELTAWFVRSDAFLRAPARVAAVAAEVCTAIVVVPLAAGVLLAAPMLDLLDAGVDGRILAAMIAAGAGWLVGDLRRRVDDTTPPAVALLVGSGWWPATVALSATVVAGVAMGTSSPVATAITMTSTAALLVVSGRPLAHGTAAWLAVTAVLAAHDDPAIACPLAAVGMLVLCSASVLRAGQVAAIVRPRHTSSSTPNRGDAEIATVYAWCLAGLAVLPLAVAMPTVLGRFDDLWVFLGWVGACWSAGLVLDRAPRVPQTRYLGSVGRASALLVGLVTPFVGSRPTAITFATVSLLGTIDAIRRRDTAAALVAAIAFPITTAATALALGATAATTAVVLAATTLAAAIVSVVVRRTVQLIPMVVAAWSTALALAMAAPDARAFATVLLFAGAALIVGAVDRGSAVLGATGGVVTCLGVWGHLDAAGVQATDAYVAPVAAALLIAGYISRQRTGLGSWAAYGPAIGLLGAAALAERLAGSSALHALVAGALGAVAVAVGGWRRLAAPLVLGTALLVAVVVSETLAYTATMPTWGWLALGGAALVATGIAMERAEIGPLETGRRVLDVVHDRFA
jgi:hypothetical protein